MTPNGKPPEEGDLEPSTIVALAASVEGSPSPSGLRERLLASYGRAGRYGIFVDRLARMFDLPVEVVEKLIAKLDDASAWKPGPGAGIEWIGVRAGAKYPNAIAAFGKLKPGARFPKHAHKGDETTLVMAGGFRDSSGVEVERGQELFEATGTEHDFVVLDGEDCIAAVIATEGVEFT
jgi:putative transcriptional regulator